MTQETSSRFGGSDVISRVALAAITCAFGIVVWQFQQAMAQINNHEQRLAVIEGNRYTEEEARADYMRWTSELAGLRNWIEQNYPPDYLKRDVAELKADVREMTRLVTQHILTDGPNPTDKKAG